jgi:membrane associated rhomboid family serine protease
MLVIGDNNPRRHIRRPWVNYALIALCVLAFLLPLPLASFALLPGQVVGGMELPPEWQGTHWSLRLLSYQFLHAGWLHLIGNLVLLWVFGDNIEDATGHTRYAVFFLLCGMAGGLAEAVLTAHRGVPVVGASGAIAGVIGAYLLLHPRAKLLVLVGYRFPVIVPASVFVALWVGINLVMALFGSGRELVAWWAHLGGFVAGLLLLPLLRWRDVALFQPADAYPAECFAGAQRYLLDLSPKTRIGARFSERAVALGKAVGFLLLIGLAVEIFLG